MSYRKCEPGCTCGLHTKGGTKCGPGCSCGRHKTQACQPECSCKRHVAYRSGIRTDNLPAVGYFMMGGHRYLTQQQGHPLASKKGQLAEHRKVLYDKIGVGPHPCHWCGKLLVWGGILGLNVDHLDGDKLNNDSENLVPSCCGCNRCGTMRKVRQHQ